MNQTVFLKGNVKTGGAKEPPNVVEGRPWHFPSTKNASVNFTILGAWPSITKKLFLFLKLNIRVMHLYKSSLETTALLDSKDRKKGHFS